jgi:hypothetical protein
MIIQLHKDRLFFQYLKYLRIIKYIINENDVYNIISLSLKIIFKKIYKYKKQN